MKYTILCIAVALMVILLGMCVLAIWIATYVPLAAGIPLVACAIFGLYHVWDGFKEIRKWSKE